MKQKFMFLAHFIYNDGTEGSCAIQSECYALAQIEAKALCVKLKSMFIKLDYISQLRLVK